MIKLSFPGSLHFDLRIAHNFMRNQRARIKIRRLLPSLTLEASGVTNINFLLTVSVYNQIEGYEN